MQSQIRRWPRQRSLITSSYKLLVPTQNIFLSVCWSKLNCINLFYNSRNVVTTRSCIYTIKLVPISSIWNTAGDLKEAILFCLSELYPYKLICGIDLSAYLPGIKNVTVLEKHWLNPNLKMCCFMLLHASSTKGLFYFHLKYLKLIFHF